MAISVNFIGDGKVTERWRYGDAFDPAKHPRGQPENKGEFGSGGGAALKAKPTAAKRKLAARGAQAQVRHPGPGGATGQQRQPRGRCIHIAGTDRLGRKIPRGWQARVAGGVHAENRQ